MHSLVVLIFLKECQSFTNDRDFANTHIVDSKELEEAEKQKSVIRQYPAIPVTDLIMRLMCTVTQGMYHIVLYFGNGTHSMAASKLFVGHQYAYLRCPGQNVSDITDPRYMMQYVPMYFTFSANVFLVMVYNATCYGTLPADFDYAQISTIEVVFNNAQCGKVEQLCSNDVMNSFS